MYQRKKVFLKASRVGFRLLPTKGAKLSFQGRIALSSGPSPPQGTLLSSLQLRGSGRSPFDSIETQLPFRFRTHMRAICFLRTVPEKSVIQPSRLPAGFQQHSTPALASAPTK